MKYTVRRSTCELSCEIEGEGRAILLIHGVGCDRSFYERAAAILKKEFRVITYDRRGYAKSKVFEESDFSVEEQAEDAALVLDGAGVMSAGIVGCSAGGIIALELAYQYPEKVEKLFLHEPPLGKDPEYQYEIGRLIEKLEMDVERRRLTRAVLDFQRAFGGIDPKMESVSMEQQKNNLDSLKLFLHQEMKDFLTYSERLSEDRELKVPCVLAAGIDDMDGIFSRFAPSAAKQLECEFLRVPGYHNLAVERPDVFAYVLQSIMYR